MAVWFEIVLGEKSGTFHIGIIWQNVDRVMTMRIHSPAELQIYSIV
jgi:hypothetical protein